MASYKRQSTFTQSHARGDMTLGGLMSMDEPMNYMQSPRAGMHTSNDSIGIDFEQAQAHVEEEIRVGTPNTRSYRVQESVRRHYNRMDSVSNVSDFAYGYMGSFKSTMSELGSKDHIESLDDHKTEDIRSYDGDGDPGTPLLPTVYEKEEDDFVKAPVEKTHFFRSLGTQGINAIVSIPLMITYAAIVYPHYFYTPNMGVLSKHIFLASAIYQVFFSLRSALPFAVGQVQSVGLIFLATMTNGIANEGTQGDKDYQNIDILGAAIIAISISTIITGLFVLLIGFFKVAGKMQYVPLPVVGGYLAYSGYFCITAGMALTAGVERCDRWRCYEKLFDFDGGLGSKFARVILSLVCAFSIRFFVRRYPSTRYPLVFPSILATIPLLFYIVLYSSGFTLKDARDNKWVKEPYGVSELEDPWDVWTILWEKDQNFADRIELILPQMATIIPMAIIVAFGSSVDIAAIQQDYPEDIDFNRELVTVGAGNVLAGACGAGYTGSFKFSQSLLALRTGVDNRYSGLLITVIELLIFFLPFSPVNFVPDFYFGALQTYIGLDIAYDWIIASHKKMTRPEYIILISTFFAVFFLGLSWGMLTGLCVASLYFSYSYANVNATACSVRKNRRTIVRPLQHHQALALFKGNMISFALEGFIFFGSSLTIVGKIRALAEKMPFTPNTQEVLNTEGLGEGSVPIEKLVKIAPRFVILDFENVQDIDATGARALFTLCLRLRESNITPILSRISANKTRIYPLLKAYNIVSDNPDYGFLHFYSLSRALEFCESQFLFIAIRYNFISQIQEEVSLKQVLESYLLPSASSFSGTSSFESLAKSLMVYFSKEVFEKGTILFAIGEQSDKLYIILSGYVIIKIDQSVGLSLNDEEYVDISEIKYRELEYGPGGIIGDIDFIMERPRSYEAVCTEKTVMLVLERENFVKIKSNNLYLTNILQAVFLQSSYMTTSHTDGGFTIMDEANRQYGSVRIIIRRIFFISRRLLSSASICFLISVFLTCTLVCSIGFLIFLYTFGIRHLTYKWTELRVPLYFDLRTKVASATVDFSKLGLLDSNNILAVDRLVEYRNKIDVSIEFLISSAVSEKVDVFVLSGEMLSNGISLHKIDPKPVLIKRKPKFSLSLKRIVTFPFGIFGKSREKTDFSITVPLVKEYTEGNNPFNLFKATVESKFEGRIPAIYESNLIITRNLNALQKILDFACPGNFLALALLITSVGMVFSASCIGTFSFLLLLLGMITRNSKKTSGNKPLSSNRLPPEKESQNLLSITKISTLNDGTIVEMDKKSQKKKMK